MTDKTQPQFKVPWEIRESNFRLFVVLKGGTHDGYIVTVDDPENLKRIVACVNFCRGVPTSTLTSATLEESVSGLGLSASDFLFQAQAAGIISKAFEKVPEAEREQAKKELNDRLEARFGP